MKPLLFTHSNHIGTLTINRPDALNAVNGELLKELQEFVTSKPDIKVLIITGQGSKAFIAGADIREMQGMTGETSQFLCALGQQVTLHIENAPFVTIAAVNGYALGGGLEIALSCDFIYCARSAKLGLPEVSLGLIPGFGGTQRLSRAVGTRMAKELIFTGRKIDAEEALRIGLANRVCDDNELLSTCQSTAEEILKNSMASVILSKRIIDQSYHLALSKALEEERHAFVRCFSCPDSKEGIQAFLDKRPPHFQGAK